LPGTPVSAHPVSIRKFGSSRDTNNSRRMSPQLPRDTTLAIRPDFQAHELARLQSFNPECQQFDLLSDPSDSFHEWLFL
jgi:hypothetical protein